MLTGPLRIFPLPSILLTALLRLHGGVSSGLLLSRSRLLLKSPTAAGDLGMPATRTISGG